MNQEKPQPAPPLLPQTEEKEKIITRILRLQFSRKGPWWNRQVPTLLGLPLIIVGITLGVALTLKVRRIQTQAQQPLSPQDIQTTNISDSSLTVSWITDQPTSGFISFGETPSLGQTSLDDRDRETAITGAYLTHHVTLSSLKPETVYYFKIGSGQKLFGKDGENFQTQTTPKLTSLSVSDPAYGQVFKPDGSAAEGAIVYLTIPGCTPLSTLIKSSGNWLIPKNLSLKEDLSAFCQYPKQGGEFSIFIQGGSQGTSKITLLSGLDKPVANITLGKDYSFKNLSLLKPLGTPQPTPTTPVEIATPSLHGDLNNDGVINTWDLAILKSNFGETPQNKAADLNQDGVVDQKDLEILLDNFNQ